MKELKVRPGTDVHDYEVRLRAAQKFLAKVSSSKPMTSGISLLVCNQHAGLFPEAANTSMCQLRLCWRMCSKF